MSRPVTQKQPRVISKKIKQSARNEQCTLRIPGVCNSNSETTVFAHMNGGGMGTKHHDIHGCYACSACHDAYDGRTKKPWEYPLIARDSDMLHAMIETQDKLIQKGLICTK